MYDYHKLFLVCGAPKRNYWLKVFFVGLSVPLPPVLLLKFTVRGVRAPSKPVLIVIFLCEVSHLTSSHVPTENNHPHYHSV